MVLVVPVYEPQWRWVNLLMLSMSSEERHVCEFAPCYCALLLCLCTAKTYTPVGAAAGTPGPVYGLFDAGTSTLLQRVAAA
jgi:hypothetical protein